MFGLQGFEGVFFFFKSGIKGSRLMRIINENTVVDLNIKAENCEQSGVKQS
jgi:hypothetical protein